MMTPHVNYRLLLLLFFAAFVINMFSYFITEKNTSERHSPYSQMKMQSEIMHDDLDREVARFSANKQVFGKNGKLSAANRASNKKFQSTLCLGSVGTYKFRPKVDLQIEHPALAENPTACSSGQPKPELAEITTSVTVSEDKTVRQRERYDLYDASETSSTNNFASNDMDMCPEIPPELGPGVMPTMEDVASVVPDAFSEVKRGGQFRPDDCKARQRVAVIMPIRDIKDQHFTSFLHYMHSFLMRQQLEYQIFLVENVNKSAPFSRALLFNVGFEEARSRRRRRGGWDCIIFHEPYLLPLDSRNLYRCLWYPRQLITQINKDRIPNDQNFGGAVAIRPDQFEVINGFPNVLVDELYVGSGYHSLWKRIEDMMYIVITVPDNIGKYRSLKNINPNKTETVLQAEVTNIPTTNPITNNGLTSLSYKTIKVHRAALYCLFRVSVDVIPDNPDSVATDKPILTSTLDHE